MADFIKRCRHFRFGKHGFYCNSSNICYRQYCQSDLFGTYEHKDGFIILVDGFRYDLKVK